MPSAAIFDKKKTTLPGFFRATKNWDLVVVHDGKLVASVEFKSHIGSFGNNANNRTEEALGNATDIWTAYREGKFGTQKQPWLGYMMFLEDAEGSRTAVAAKEPHFKVFPEFKNASYAKRYKLLCERLVRERLYHSACLLLSARSAAATGAYSEPDEGLSIEQFVAGLLAHTRGEFKPGA